MSLSGPSVGSRFFNGSLMRTVAMGLIGLGIVFLWRMNGQAKERLEEVRQRLEPNLKAKLAKRGLRYGSPVFIRVFKESSEMELWIEAKPDASWERFEVYPIARYSGKLGPKLAEGDLQAPEGFYAVKKGGLNPLSRFHLSFNIGYPNAYDRFHQRTGSLIMVHGSDVSVGCFAMTDALIEEIYLLVDAALRQGQDEVKVHCFPFRMTEARLREAEEAQSDWLSFWREELQPSHDAFDQYRVPPEVVHQEGRYRLRKLETSLETTEGAQKK